MIILHIVYIAGFMKAWSMKTTAVLLKLGQTKVIISPMSEKSQKREKEEKGARAREKKTSDSL